MNMCYRFILHTNQWEGKADYTTFKKDWNECANGGKTIFSKAGAVGKKLIEPLQDKIIDKNYFVLLPVTYNSENYKTTPTESESDNPERFCLESSCIVFNWKHKYFPFPGKTNNMCSLNKGCSIWSRNISPPNSRWYQQKAYQSSTAVGNLLGPWNRDCASVVSMSSGPNSWEMFIKCVE